MPLSFETLDHGDIAFGFFNIESDMLLLEEHFFFAEGFCAEVSAVAGSAPREGFRRVLAVHTVRRREDAGDLMGAIHGVRFTGFIGETYRRYPFPPLPEDFRQNPHGARTRPAILEMVRRYSREEEISFEGDPASSQVGIGDYHFSRKGFLELVRYVWRGGYPRWRDEERPDYVLAMRAAVCGSDHWAFRGLELAAGPPPPAAPEARP